MKKLFIICLLLVFINTVSLKAYSATGHELFTEIKFEEEGTLLVDMTSSQISLGYKDLGRAKFIGWKNHYFTVKEEATYVGEIIFAKSNRSREPMEIDYTLKDTEFKERSITIGGSLSGNFKKNIKGIDTQIGAKVEGDVTNVSSNQRVQETKFTATVMPNYRLIFRETGDALVTNGVSKYYFFGITMNKGEWEYIDIVTRYYELYEEEIN